MKKPVNTIAIIGATFSGNKGAASMLKSILGMEKTMERQIKFNVLSVYPEEDNQQNKYPAVTVVPYTPEKLLFWLFPLAVLFQLLGKPSVLKKLLLTDPAVKAMAESDLIVDAAGISFVDSRGLIMSIYNFACCFVPLAMGVKVVKYSQAMGPFKKLPNRLLAQYILRRVEVVCARGQITHSHLKELQLKNVELCADSGFAMPEKISPQQQQQLAKYLHYPVDKPLVTVCVSSVVEKLCNKQNKDYPQIMAQFINSIVNNYNVLILPHSARDGKTAPKNNDLIISRKVYELVNNQQSCQLIDCEMEPEELRYLISKSKILVTSRFHGMISGLAVGVPTLVLGWSHKYLEVLNMFNLNDYCLGYDQLTLQDIQQQFTSLANHSEQVQHQINQHLPQVKEMANKNIQIVSKLLP